MERSAKKLSPTIAQEFLPLYHMLGDRIVIRAIRLGPAKPSRTRPSGFLWCSDSLFSCLRLLAVL